MSGSSQARGTTEVMAPIIWNIKRKIKMRKERGQVAHIPNLSKEVPVNHPCVYNRRVVSSAKPSPSQPMHISNNLNHPSQHTKTRKL